MASNGTQLTVCYRDGIRRYLVGMYCLDGTKWDPGDYVYCLDGPEWYPVDVYCLDGTKDTKGTLFVY